MDREFFLLGQHVGVDGVLPLILKHYDTIARDTISFTHDALTAATEGRHPDGALLVMLISCYYCLHEPRSVKYIADTWLSTIDRLEAGRRSKNYSLARDWVRTRFSEAAESCAGGAVGNAEHRVHTLKTRKAQENAWCKAINELDAVLLSPQFASLIDLKMIVKSWRDVVSRAYHAWHDGGKS